MSAYSREQDAQIPLAQGPHVQQVSTYKNCVYASFAIQVQVKSLNTAAQG